MALGERTWEREAGAGLSPLEHVRLSQATGAFAQAVLLNPDAGPAHESLAQLFVRRNMIDLARRHAAAAARLARRAGPLSGESSETFDERAAKSGAFAEALETAVQDNENRFLVRTAGRSDDPLGRARVAVELGLTQRAIDVLRASHPDLYGASGLGLLIDLLIQTGQVADARVLLDREELRRNPRSLGVYSLARTAKPDGTRGTYQFQAYDWLDFCQNAVAGRYLGALAALDRLSERLAEEERRSLPGLETAIAWTLASELGYCAPPVPPTVWLRTTLDRVAAAGLLAQNRALSVAQADLATVAGVLELERGDPRAAAVRFEGAMRRFTAPAVARLSRPGEPLAARYLKELRDRR
jgi:hypothetical protein